MREGRRAQVVTLYWPKPIPIKTADWEAHLDGWEPGQPKGHGPTEADAVYDLYVQIDERELEEEEANVDG